MSELEYFERDCEITVLPQPKAPGIAVVPPCTALQVGKNLTLKAPPYASDTTFFRISAPTFLYHKCIDKSTRLLENWTKTGEVDNVRHIFLFIWRNTIPSLYASLD